VLSIVNLEQNQMKACLLKLARYPLSVIVQFGDVLLKGLSFGGSVGRVRHAVEEG
jgi:hypothetical protein